MCCKVIWGILALLLFASIGCEEKDYCAYSQSSCENPDTPDSSDMTVDMSGGECMRDADCVNRSNASAQCTVSGACVYTCNEGWAFLGDQLGMDGCTCDKSKSSCLPVAVCGDGIVEGDELCDEKELNNDDNPDACRSNCRPAYCGDGVQDSSESCDDGNGADNDDCTTACSKCGNGKLDEGETCDDGQVPAKNGDGCSDSCQVETQWDFQCSDELPNRCWQQLNPPGGDRGIVSTNVAKNKDHLFVSWRVKGDGPGSIWVYKKNDLGAWVKFDELKDPAGANGGYFACDLHAFDDEVFCFQRSQDPQDNQGRGLIYRFRRDGERYLPVANDVSFGGNGPGVDVVDFSVNSKYGVFLYKQNGKRYVSMSEKLSGVWSQMSRGVELNDLSYYLNDVGDDGVILWFVTSCNLNGVTLNGCSAISNVKSLIDFKFLRNPNAMSESYLSPWFLWGKGAFASSEQGFWYLTENEEPVFSSFPVDYDGPNDRADIERLNDLVWLARGKGKESFVQELSVDNGRLDFTGKKYFIPKAPISDVYLSVRDVDDKHIFITETGNSYTSSLAFGTIFILPR